jgi:hypothetical protein
MCFGEHLEKGACNWKCESYLLDCAQKISTPFGSNYLTGRKRIAIDSNVHKSAIFSDELENLKQLNFSLQKFESDNIEFEKSVLIYIYI